MALEVTQRDMYRILAVPANANTNKVAEDLQEQVATEIANGNKHFALDFSALEILPSHLLATIGTLFRRISQQQGSMCAILDNQEIIEIFNLSGLNLLVPVFPNTDRLPKIHEGAVEQHVHSHTKTVTNGESPNVRVDTWGGFKIIRVKEKTESSAVINEFAETISRLTSEGEIHIILDLRNLTFVTSDVLMNIVVCYRRVQAHDGETHVLTDSHDVRNLIELSGLSGLVGVFTDEEELRQRTTESRKTRVRKRILIVDDSKVMRELMVKKVSELGYDTLTAADGREGVEIATKERPELVLMDVTMPDMDGYEACKAIKENASDPYVPVIFVTNLQQPAEKLNALNAGGDDFINKPVQNEDLLFRIRTHLRMKELTESFRHINENLEKLVDAKTKTLIETERQLYQAEKMSTIGTMLSGIAHELKNPIFVVSSWAQRIVQKGGLNDTQAKGLKYIQDQAVRMASIVENLLTLVRKKVLDVKNLNPNVMIENVHHNLEYLVKSKEVEIATDLQAMSQIQGNVAEIEQIIVNLVSNAVDAVEGKGRVTVSTRDDGKQCVIAVSDNGAGMDEETKQKIFDPFFTTKDPGKGTGLGMSIIYKIVQAHRGEVKIDSAKGKGTTVSVYLPRV